MSKTDTVRRVTDLATRYGYEISTANNGHLRLNKPGYPTLFFSGTPGDHRAWKNAIAKIRRNKPYAKKQKAH